MIQQKTKKKQISVFQFHPFSKKQRQVFNWWTEKSPVKDFDGIIADGAIRSGKSLCMSLSFVMWAMYTYNGENFAMCGKSVGSFRRNVLMWLKQMLRGRGYEYVDHRSDNLLTVRRGNVENYFYIFGGRDERSQDFIQGITLAGVFLDEVALMPESFVNQATGRCSVDGSKLWFNCNPSYPSHWFKKEWIDRAKTKNLIYLHFTMDDNLSLSERVKARYRSMYAGVFYKRYIQGLWALAEGIIYPMYEDAIEDPPEGKPSDYVLSIDYGTMNAFAALLWAKYGNVWYAIDEYYYSGRDEGITKTDEEYGDDLDKFTQFIVNERQKKYEKEKKVDLYAVPPARIKTIIDPSAASFIALLQKKDRYKVVHADNAVLDGIRETASAMQLGKIKIARKCKHFIEELSGYAWDDTLDDSPIKENDHACDSARYFVKTMRIAIHKREYRDAA